MIMRLNTNSEYNFSIDPETDRGVKDIAKYIYVNCFKSNVKKYGRNVLLPSLIRESPKNELSKGREISTIADILRIC